MIIFYLFMQGKYSANTLLGNDNQLEGAAVKTGHFASQSSGA